MIICIDAIVNELEPLKIEKNYRVQELDFADEGVLVVFLDNPGTMKRMREFLDILVPKLKAAVNTGQKLLKYSVRAFSLLPWEWPRSY